MKMKFLCSFLWSVIVFLGATLGFTACSSDEDLANVKQAPGQEQGVVKTEFTISFPQQTGGITRQSIDIVQGQTPPVFRGLQNMELRPFLTSAEGVHASTTLPSVIALGESDNSLGYNLANTALIGASKSHVYKDIEIAIGTRSFMFYGLAKNKSVTSGSANIPNGALRKTVDGTKLAGITFSPEPIVGNASLNTEAGEIATYLTNIATATYGTETTLTYFPNFTTIKCGSWNSVKAAVQQIYSVVYDKAAYDAQGAATNLYGAIASAILKQGDDIFAEAGTGANAGKLIFTGTTVNKTFTYPQNMNLPDGAVLVNWNDTDKKFEAVASGNNLGMDITTLDKYVYPASLWYYGLSNIKTTDSSMETYYNSTNTWAQILAEYDAAPSKSTVVQSTTRSIAIEKEIQYAVGRLDVTVTSENGKTTLEDNIIASTSGSTVTYHTIDFDGDDFPITGIIVGNQRPVDYQFATKEGATQYTVYDSQVYNQTETPNCYLTPVTTSDNATHTLVLQTPVAGGEEDENANVKIAVEFLNNSGQTIVGKDNQIIYPDTKFYLVGKLIPSKNTSQKFTGTDDLIKQAFVKDYVTNAHFVVKSLRNAYNLLPDLRSPHLEIGMSVDLTWKNGISQDIIIE